MATSVGLISVYEMQRNIYGGGHITESYVTSYKHHWQSSHESLFSETLMALGYKFRPQTVKNSVLTQHTQKFGCGKSVFSGEQFSLIRKTICLLASLTN